MSSAKIDEKTFKKYKKMLKTPADDRRLAESGEISATTAFRIRKSDTYLDYLERLAESHRDKDEKPFRKPKILIYNPPKEVFEDFETPPTLYDGFEYLEEPKVKSHRWQIIVPVLMTVALIAFLVGLALLGGGAE